MFSAVLHVFLKVVTFSWYFNASALSHMRRESECVCLQGTERTLVGAWNPGKTFTVKAKRE